MMLVLSAFSRPTLFEATKGTFAQYPKPSKCLAILHHLLCMAMPGCKVISAYT